MKYYKEDYDKTKEEVVKKTTKSGNIIARVAIIAVMVLAIAIMLILINSYYSIDTMIERNERKVTQEAEKNKSDISATLADMEKHRDYLAMNYYTLNNRLQSSDEYMEYTRVFTAATSYEVIYKDILNIVDGYDEYGEKTKDDWCLDIAIYIADWNMYVEGEFWNDTPDSPMHAGEHGEFLKDAKHDVQDMVQVYFELTDEQAESMWNMEQSDIAEMLCEKCKVLYPEV